MEGKHSRRHKAVRFTIVGILILIAVASNGVLAASAFAQQAFGTSFSHAETAAVAEATEADAVDLCGYSVQLAAYDSHPWLKNLSLFGGIEGSKQPQDFGVNANLGGRFHANWGAPLLSEYGLGMQLGTALVHSDNAVRVYELLGETGGRRQSYTTAGVFQRFDSGFSWGFAYDFLYQESFDNFFLGQWRIRTAYDFSTDWQLGLTVYIADRSDSGDFSATTVTLDPISQAHVYLRRFWSTGVQTTFWAGLSDGHGENNAVTGPSRSTNDVFLMGADFVAPLNNRLALYGETNLMMPADTGTVDAFLGVQWFPWGNAKRARRTAYAPLLPVAGSPTFSVDLAQ